jgi:two-component system, cell cycle response regulator DivK
MSSPHAGATILLTEDNEPIRFACSAILRRMGYTVLEAEEGSAAVQMASEHLPHLILMDLGLPGMDGWTATARIRDDPRTCHIPIIAITAFADEDAEARAREAGCAAILQKPFLVPELIGVVESELARSPGLTGT